MQEKLAEAIFKESQCSSEPEFSDTSTEEDEGASVKTQQDGQGKKVDALFNWAVYRSYNANYFSFIYLFPKYH